MVKAKKVVKKVVREAEDKFKAEVKSEDKCSCDCYVWLAVIALLAAVPIVTLFVPIVLGIFLLVKAGKSSKPVLISVLALLAILLQIAVIALKVLITFYTV